MLFSNFLSKFFFYNSKYISDLIFKMFEHERYFNMIHHCVQVHCICMYVNLLTLFQYNLIVLPVFALIFFTYFSENQI
jgi:hypothetical protein